MGTVQREKRSGASAAGLGICKRGREAELRRVTGTLVHWISGTVSSRDAMPWVRSRVTEPPGIGSWRRYERATVRLDWNLASLQHPGVTRRDLEPTGSQNSGLRCTGAVSLFLVLKRRGRREERPPERQVPRRSRCGSCPVLNPDAARPAGVRPESAAPAEPGRCFWERWRRTPGEREAASSKPGMELQRFDSYQGGAGPDFNEHILHKVRISSGPPPPSQRWERTPSPGILSIPLSWLWDFEPEEPFLFDPACCPKQRYVGAGGEGPPERLRLSGASFVHLNHLSPFLIHSLLPLIYLNSCVNLVGGCVCPPIQAPTLLVLVVVVVKDLNSWPSWLKLDIEMLCNRNKLLFSNETVLWLQKAALQPWLHYCLLKAFAYFKVFIHALLPSFKILINSILGNVGLLLKWLLGKVAASLQATLFNPKSIALKESETYICHKKPLFLLIPFSTLFL